MNRRGYIFTILSLMLVLIIFSVVAVRTSRQDARASGLHDHVLSANAFLEQLEEDLPRVLRITGYRGLLGLEEHVSTTGSYIDDLPSAFTSVVTNGTVNGTSYRIMDDATLDVYESRVQQVAQGLGLSLDVELSNVSLGHVDHFLIEINATVRVLAQTRDSRTGWDYDQTVTERFSIDELKDPLYAVETLGRVPVVIRPTNLSRPYITNDNDTTSLQTLWNQTHYLNDTDAPSLLMRFTGNLSSSPYGIASLVPIKEIDSQDLPVHTDRSLVDYLYFGGSSTSTNQIVNMPDEFLIDDDHLDDYDAEGKTR